MDIRGSTTGRAIRTKWNSDLESIEIPRLHRSSATSSELDQKKGAQAFENSIIYRSRFPETGGTGYKIWSTDSLPRCR